jgi:hypothetical protein
MTFPSDPSAGRSPVLVAVDDEELAREAQIVLNSARACTASAVLEGTGTLEETLRPGSELDRFATGLELALVYQLRLRELSSEPAPTAGALPTAASLAAIDCAAALIYRYDSARAWIADSGLAPFVVPQREWNKVRWHARPRAVAAAEFDAALTSARIAAVHLQSRDGSNARNGIYDGLELLLADGAVAVIRDMPDQEDPQVNVLAAGPDGEAVRPDNTLLFCQTALPLQVIERSTTRGSADGDISEVRLELAADDPRRRSAVLLRTRRGQARLQDAPSRADGAER